MDHVFLFTPDTGILVLTMSVILIFVELNRPGMVFPGSLGLTGVLLVGNSARHWQLSTPAVLLLFFTAFFCLWQVRHASPRWWAYPSALAFAVAFAYLVKASAPAPVHAPFYAPVAALCGCVVGASASVLARIAHRARENKGLD